MIYDDRSCKLGEGPLWHPKRNQLFWFDILSKKLLTKGQEWQFDEHVSAAGWVDQDRLLVASETALFTFDLTTGHRVHVCDLEAQNPITRSNDGRSDPWGGFWIGTMGKNAEPDAGAIYRYYKGELRQLFAPITISNAICFTPDGHYAYFTDTPTQRIMRQPLDYDGWPKDAPRAHIDLRGKGLNPDGAVVDQDGVLWCAQWGVSRVAAYDQDGSFLRAVEFPASQISCPALADDKLFATSATIGLKDPQDHDGKTFCIEIDVAGQPEHRVLI
ncbi:SMP-30/gluconolactonase/LRE family protein [Pseudaestuariivita rosea]|uniref:SMP-30/gluconolactonase/LRE family protein n=1 Tax=Pseudaestuariivita rosea TaxID=2763263 RepID=UPI001ABAF2C6|nr:SMP-30/gluconolactonase/LRE family protein [Pseudaestuariivita rosea]